MTKPIRRTSMTQGLTPEGWRAMAFVRAFCPGATAHWSSGGSYDHVGRLGVGGTGPITHKVTGTTLSGVWLALEKKLLRHGQAIITSAIAHQEAQGLFSATTVTLDKVTTYHVLRRPVGLAHPVRVAQSHTSLEAAWAIAILRLERRHLLPDATSHDGGFDALFAEALR